MGWIGQLWPADLDKVAQLFVAHRLNNKLPVTFDIWIESLITLLRTADCKCAKGRKCTTCCTHNLPYTPKHVQPLAKALIGAEAYRGATILQKTPALPHIINTNGADRAWGTSDPSAPDCPNCNYIYTPTQIQQANALETAARHKTTSYCEKSLGLIALNPEALKQLESLPLSIVALLPPNAIKLHAPNTARAPRKKSGNPISYGLVMAVAPSAQTSDETEVLTTLNALRCWKDKFCPEARRTKTASSRNSLAARALR